MGGGQQTPAGSIEKSNLDQGFSDQLRGIASQFSQQTGQYQNAANQAAGKVNTNFQQYAPNLNTNFNQFAPQLQTNFAPTGQLDAQSQSMLSAADQQRANQLSTQTRAVASQFAGSPGLAQILQTQAAQRSRLSANPMLSQVFADQNQRQQQTGLLNNQAALQQAQQGAAVQQQGNQAQLQQTETNANLAGAGNAALGQQLQFQAQPLASQQNLASVFGNLAQLYGSQQITPTGGGGPSTFESMLDPGHFIFNGSNHLSSGGVSSANSGQAFGSIFTPWKLF
jgi:hypothetical protein